ncbi:hypothetical protein [Gottschalkia purinilytica]|nr:hypothetical protein [Gottschalkia purinilytica]
MYDINFFTPYLKESKLKKNKLFIKVTIITLTVLIFILFNIFSNLYIENLKMSITKLKELDRNLEDNSLKRLKKDIKNLENYYDLMISVNNTLCFDDYINNYIIEKIFLCFSEQVNVEKIHISNKEVTIEGRLKDIIISENLLKNLRDINIFQDLNISNIEKYDNEYYFVIEGEMKSVKEPY